VHGGKTWGFDDIEVVKHRGEKIHIRSAWDKKGERKREKIKGNRGKTMAF